MNIRPDIIITWPRNCDYPIWRSMIHDFRTNFNNVIIAFHETNSGEDYREFIKETMYKDFCFFVNPPQITGDEDWRNISIKYSLFESYNSEWVWFTEQDFFPKENFFEEVQKHVDNNCDVISVYDGPRMHPCCIFVKRETLNKTSKDFSIIPGVLDHFGKFQKEVETMGVKIGIIDEKTYLHMNGLSHNLRLIYEGEPVTYYPEKFRKYIIASLKVDLPIDQRYLKMCEKYLSKTTPDT